MKIRFFCFILLPFLICGCGLYLPQKYNEEKLISLRENLTLYQRGGNVIFHDIVQWENSYAISGSLWEDNSLDSISMILLIDEDRKILLEKKFDSEEDLRGINNRGFGVDTNTSSLLYVESQGGDAFFRKFTSINLTLDWIIKESNALSDAPRFTTILPHSSGYVIAGKKGKFFFYDFNGNNILSDGSEIPSDSSEVYVNISETSYRINAIAPISGGRYIAAGLSDESSATYGLLFTVGDDGNVINSKVLNGSGDPDELFDVVSLGDGTFAVGGGDCILKVDENLRIQWKTHINPEGIVGETRLVSIAFEANGGIIGAAGYTNVSTGLGSPYGNYDCLVYTVDTNGSLVRIDRFGGSYSDKIHSIVPNKAATGFVVAGETNSANWFFSGVKEHGKNAFIYELP